MKGQLKVSTPEEYLASVDESRRTDITELDRIIRKNAPKLEPFILIGMLGYGPYHYKYASGREGETCRIGVASNKGYISLYVNGADQFRDQLPKANIGKGCVRFRKLSDLNMAALVRLIKTGAKWADK